jgi:hypothetical protein
LCYCCPQVTLNPEGAAADALRQWWDAEGSSAALTPLGQAAAAGGAAGGPRSNKLQFLSDVMVSVVRGMKLLCVVHMHVMFTGISGRML